MYYTYMVRCEDISKSCYKRIKDVAGWQYEYQDISTFTKRQPIPVVEVVNDERTRGALIAPACEPRHRVTATSSERPLARRAPDATRGEARPPRPADRPRGCARLGSRHPARRCRRGCAAGGLRAPDDRPSHTGRRLALAAHADGRRR